MSDADDEAVEQTTDPTLARTIIEERDGFPAHLDQSEGEGDSGLLRVGFQDRDLEMDLREISWDEFTEEFEEKDLAAFYRDDGGDVAGDRPVVLRDREAAEEAEDSEN